MAGLVPWAFSPRTSSVGIHEKRRKLCRFPWMPGTRLTRLSGSASLSGECDTDVPTVQPKIVMAGLVPAIHGPSPGAGRRGCP